MPDQELNEFVNEVLDEEVDLSQAVRFDLVAFGPPFRTSDRIVIATLCLVWGVHVPLAHTVVALARAKDDDLTLCFVGQGHGRNGPEFSYYPLSWSYTKFLSEASRIDAEACEVLTVGLVRALANQKDEEQSYPVVSKLGGYRQSFPEDYDGTPDKSG